jgi:hypothetical protein
VGGIEEDIEGDIKCVCENVGGSESKEENGSRESA